jgi:hypothetical protein
MVHRAIHLYVTQNVKLKTNNFYLKYFSVTDYLRKYKDKNNF